MICNNCGHIVEPDEERDLNLLKEVVIKYHRTYTPLTCPACKELYAHSENKTGICDSCYVKEILQRNMNAAYLASKEEDTHLALLHREDFDSWLIDTHIDKHED